MNRPWITFEAAEWLESFLSFRNKNAVGFEYGSGGSTVYLARHLKKLISVEHDKKWYKYISKILRDNIITNCEYLLIEPEKINDKNINISKNMKKYTSAVPKYMGMTFEKYVKYIESFPDNIFDLIFVDGRARPSCILHAISKVRPSGYILLDNSERKLYQEVEKKLSNWERKDFFGPGPYNLYFWQTTIWKKPDNYI